MTLCVVVPTLKLQLPFVSPIASVSTSLYVRWHADVLVTLAAGEGRDIELRHQRNSDVLFDCIRTSEGEP